MPQNSPEVLTFVTALAISVVSGSISILNRIVKGHNGGALWVISEFLAAILCGYLAWDAYPQVRPYLPDWVSLPIFIAASAHTSGRLIQTISNLLTDFVSGVKRPSGGKNDGQ